MNSVSAGGENVFSDRITDAISAVLAGQGKLTPGVFDIDGMSGRMYRLLINTLIGSIADARYLEIGTWQGSTLCSAIFKNDVTALAIDNWAEFGGPSNKFFANLAAFKTAAARVSFLERDFREVDYSSIGRFNVYLFDGPHERADQIDGIVRVQPALDDQFVLIVDDWNAGLVREGTRMGLRDAGLRVDYSVEIRTTHDETHPAHSGKESDWHNGYFIAACTKTA